jgi:hypothetical protein
MTRIERINADSIRENPSDPRHPRAILPGFVKKGMNRWRLK